MHWFGKILVKNFRNDVLIYCWLMIMIRLYEIKIFISKGIYKSLVNLIWINIIFKSNIVFSITFRRLYKIYISGGIIYYDAPIIQSLVLNIFLKVHIIIWDKKTMESSFFNNFFHNGCNVDLQTASDRLIRNYYIHLMETFNGPLWYIVGKGIMANDILQHIEVLILTIA